MPVLNEQVDQYIKQAPAFAQPILAHLRQLVHQAIPNITETIKWSRPHFEYYGVVCYVGAFKHHCAFGFWNAPSLSDPDKLLTAVGNSAMGQLGPIKSVADLPADAILIKYLQEVAALNQASNNQKPGKPKPKTTPQPEVTIPDYFLEVLNQNPAARTTFENFSPGYRKEYLEWLADAKTDATRQKRLQTTLAWLAEGKTKNWKYMKK